jgi:ATP-dependent DNA helicase DinG
MDGAASVDPPALAMGAVAERAHSQAGSPERWLFTRLPEWEETSQRPQPAQITLPEAAITLRLAEITGVEAEPRPAQQAYAKAAGHIFTPRVSKGAPAMLLAEAGTGTGKTGLSRPRIPVGRGIGRNRLGQHLHQGIAATAQARSGTRLGPLPGPARVVVRKGRENYLCLLNLEDALQGGFQARAAIMAQLVARWAAYSADGDMIGGDLPGWLPTLFRNRGVAALTDRRGECVYAGCPHYRKCFIERSARASAEAELVIANHALVMVNAARGRDVAQRPTRIIFDEGHHIFEAADSTFAAELTGSEAIELRRWVIGPEKGSKGRRRGLSARLADITSYDEAGAQAITDARNAAEGLPADGWLARVVEGNLRGHWRNFWPPYAPRSLPAMKAAGRMADTDWKPRQPGWTDRSLRRRSMPPRRFPPCAAR